MNDPHLAQLPVLEPGLAQRRHALWKADVLRMGSALSLTGMRARLRSERGAATAEYAITTLAAVGFAGLLVVVLRSGEVRSMLTDIIRSALSIPS